MKITNLLLFLSLFVCMAGVLFAGSTGPGAAYKAATFNDDNLSFSALPGFGGSESTPNCTLNPQGPGAGTKNALLSPLPSNHRSTVMYASYDSSYSGQSGSGSPMVTSYFSEEALTPPLFLGAPNNHNGGGRGPDIKLPPPVGPPVFPPPPGPGPGDDPTPPPSATPEPGTMLILGLGAAASVPFLRRRKK